MKKLLLSVCVLLAVALPGSAQIFTNFAVTINGAQEVPANASPGVGGGLVTLDTNLNVLSFVGMSYSGLSANSTASHFHGPAGVGTNAAVLYNLSGNTTLGGTSGSYSGTVTLVAGGFEIRGQLIAVPEPGVLVLSAVGFGLLGLRALRRK
ncbi:MAG: CHRD domain-containing protein [Verrucomicrobia bacterium]|nr:CHRD domain-containing protein [Verrucomicrobiota bacterium]